MYDMQIFHLVTFSQKATFFMGIFIYQIQQIWRGGGAIYCCSEGAAGRGR